MADIKDGWKHVKVEAEPKLLGEQFPEFLVKTDFLDSQQNVNIEASPNYIGVPFLV